MARGYCAGSSETGGVGGIAAAAPDALQPAAPAATPAAAAETNEALAAVSPAHSAMVMNKALDNIFSKDIDQAMMSHLPDYWQEYFASKSQHRPFMPADASIKVVGDGVTPPQVLNSIDPSSNEFAQEFGIAGMEQLRSGEELALPSGDGEWSARTRGCGSGRDLPHLLQPHQTRFGGKRIEGYRSGLCSRGFGC